MTAPKTSHISVIIPTLNEENQLRAQLAVLQAGPDLQVIVADGGSTDQTRKVARQLGAQVLTSRAGRGCRLNLGADAASGTVLLFLHCDTGLPPDFIARIHHTLASPGTAAGAFHLRIDGAGIGCRLVERGANLRAKLLQLPYGDQGIFLRKEVFKRAGGFKDLPIMEDLEFVRRLRSIGAVRIAASSVTTSARRWQELGVLRTTLINQVMLAGYFLGVDPRTLRSWYYRRTGRDGKTDQS